MRVKLLLSFLSFLFSTFIIFLCLEFNPVFVSRLNLNLIHYFALKERYRTDESLIFRMKANYLFQGSFQGDAANLSLKHAALPPFYRAQFDSEGFRNSGFSGKPDAAIIGDSYIQFGFDEQDTFSFRFEKTSGLKTLNYGMEWYGPFQYLEVFKRFVIPKHPDYVLLCFFEGNDLRDMREYQKWKNGGNYYHFDLTDKNIFQRYALAMRDTFMFFGKKLVRNWDSRKVTLDLSGNPIETVFVYGTDPRSTTELRDSDEIHALGLLLNDFKRTSMEIGVTPAVVFIPSKRHIYQTYQIDTQDSSGLENLETAVSETVFRSDLPWISLTPAFNAAAKQGQFLYYENDTHWNSEGRQLAALFVWNELKRLHLLRE